MKILLFTIVAVSALAANLQAQVVDLTPQTPLIGALLHRDSVAARQLLEDGADPNEGRFVGFSPVILAIVRQDVALVRLMAAKGADLQVRDRSGSTPLMWAAFNETGDAAMVDALLALGADPGATNKAGETALDWALRRGETPAVAALRKCGSDSDNVRIKASVERAVALLQKSGAEFTRVSGCASCHHQFLPQIALGVARQHGIAVDEAAAREQVESMMAMFKTVYREARTNRDRIPDPPIGVSYALLGFAAAKYPADEVTSTLTEVIGAWQHDDGAFYTLPGFRPPIEASDVTATALSIAALQRYGTSTDERVARGREWLRSANARTTEERAMRLLGLAWAKAPAGELRTASDALLAEQQPDGGWSQLSTTESDAYATGQALVALEAAGHAATSTAYRRGVGFLLRTQFPDGSWLVRSRTFAFQPPKDSGFPHGRHQWVSAAGTSWAAMALALALPESSDTTSR